MISRLVRRHLPLRVSRLIVADSLGLAVFGLIWALVGCGSGKHQPSVKYGITPYQDSALPVVADALGWYNESGISAQMVPATWGDVVTGISSGAIDVAVYNFNSFQAPYANAAQGPRKPVFYCPLFLFKGQAIMIKTESSMIPFKEVPGEDPVSREKRVSDVARQLKGKRIAVTVGTELDQIVITALQKAGLDSKKDVTMINASPEDSLAAFLSGNVDAFAAGLTERTEARRHGGVELLVASDVTLPVVDGLITSEQFAQSNGALLDQLCQTWFRTVRFMEEDLGNHSQYVLGYLAKSASTRYSPEEYKIAWTFDQFPHTAKEADETFNAPSSPYFWKRAWDANNEFLLRGKKIATPVPYSAYWGEKVLARLAQTGK